MSHLYFVHNHRSLSENHDHIWLPLIILSILMIIFIVCAWCGLFLCCIRKYCCKPRISISKKTVLTNSTKTQMTLKQLPTAKSVNNNTNTQKSMKGVSRIQYLGTLER